MTKEFCKLLQRRIGRTSIGPSTARGMGPKGTISAARSYLEMFDLRRISRARSESEFRSRLNMATGELQKKLPKGARYWGSSRKFLNIFLRSCLYNRYLCKFYGLAALESWLEIPLDSHVAKGLALDVAKRPATVEGVGHLPRWKTVIGLTRRRNRKYQAVALNVARAMGTERVHLDLRYWRGDHMIIGLKKGSINGRSDSQRSKWSQDR